MNSEQSFWNAEFVSNHFFSGFRDHRTAVRQGNANAPQRTVGGVLEVVHAEKIAFQLVRDCQHQLERHLELAY